MTYTIQLIPWALPPLSILSSPQSPLASHQSLNLPTNSCLKVSHFALSFAHNTLLRNILCCLLAFRWSHISPCQSLLYNPTTPHTFYHITIFIALLILWKKKKVLNCFPYWNINSLGVENLVYLWRTHLKHTIVTNRFMLNVDFLVPAQTVYSGQN